MSCVLILTFLSLITLASLGPFSLGSSLGWSAPVLPVLVNNSNFDFTLTEAAWAASILSLGQALSAIPGGIVRNRYGTKFLRVLYSIPCICGWLLITYANCSWMVKYRTKFLNL